VEVAGEVDAFAGFAVAGEDAFGFGLDAAGVVDELAAVAVTCFSSVVFGWYRVVGL
jgi:hypoxanthine-guanine phosphoribosyltransferase